MTEDNIVAVFYTLGDQPDRPMKTRAELEEAIKEICEDRLPWCKELLGVYVLDIKVK